MPSNELELLCSRMASLWVKNGMSLQELWKYQHILEAAILKEATIIENSLNN